MEHHLNDHKDHPNRHQNNYKMYDKKGHPFLSLTHFMTLVSLYTP